MMLSFDLEFKDLYCLEGLTRLHSVFLNYLKDSNDMVYSRLISAYAGTLEEQEKNQLYVEVAPYIEDFIGYLFDISEQIQIYQERHKTFSMVPKVKRTFVQRYALRCKIEPPSIKPSLPVNVWGSADFDLLFSHAVAPLMHDITANEKELQPFVAYVHWAMHTDDGKKNHKDSILFQSPIKMTAQDYFLSQLEQGDHTKCFTRDHADAKRQGFDLTDTGHSFKKAYDTANYCIFCHHQNRDSCRQGHPKNTIHTGCPLDQKISQMAAVKTHGYNIGALAIICVDNPLVPATGHRICNDCRQACIYQNQESVDIPGVESEILREVLQLPYGFEIYSLLTKWNPLNFEQPLPLEAKNNHVLVVGQGPSGFGLAHYLMRSGVTVLAIDGVKIEPLEPQLLTIANPIKNIGNYLTPLSKRLVSGFGGVAEYGITVRWDKNNLFLIRLLLERNHLYTLKGGIYFGTQLTADHAFEQGIDHIALCTGAGSPRLMGIKNELANGVLLASDFLMGLQLSSAFKEKSLSCLTINMPIVVIGGGLTAIDAATEAQGYYLKQIESIQHRITDLKTNNKYDALINALSLKERNELDIWLMHAEELAQEKHLAHDHNLTFDPVPLLQKWGGCTIVYRKEIKDSPAVKLNPDEVRHAFREGLFLLEESEPLEFIIDDNNHVTGVLVQKLNQKTTLPARSVLVAVGTTHVGAV
ncbi:MAG TPA: glutamate synthase subunit beta [Holosporales bacterium]|nr:glutamate synthase subunit beta [Holosporales bacterium]